MHAILDSSAHCLSNNLWVCMPIYSLSVEATVHFQEKISGRGELGTL